MRRARWFFMALIMALVSGSAFAQSSSSVLGDWREPGGSVIEIFRCGDAVCARLLVIRKNAPFQTDVHNPDSTLRTRVLCGLRIGYSFHLDDPAHAEGGKLYDPKSGRLYSGAMHTEGDSLKLRGYVGIKLFGRTETWTRVPPGLKGCAPA